MPWLWAAIAGGVIVYLLMRTAPAAAGGPIEVTVGKVVPL